MRSMVVIGIALSTYGCTSLEGAKPAQRLTQIAQATEPECDKPGVWLDSIKRAGSPDAEPLPDRSAPVSLKPGRYEIAVGCQNPLNQVRGACTFWGHPNEYPTYKMLLKAGVRYTFHCYESGADLSYKITESDL